MGVATPPRLAESNDLAPEIPGPAVAHCGQWWPITSLPWWCPACGALLGLEEEHTWIYT